MLEKVGVQAVIEGIGPYLAGARQIEGANKGMGQSAVAAADSSTKSARSFGSLIPVVAGASVAIGGAVVIGKSFADAASDLNEAINKANVVFGAHSDVISAFAKTSASSYGISQRAANEYAGTLGNILKSSGLSEDASADMSVELLKLAADLASFNNIPIDEALEKIRSGLVGEAEPLRTVGVLLSEAAVQAKAYEMGIADQGSALTDAQKVQARYAVIMEQTTDAQGDFNRTAEGSANQQRIMGAQWEDLRAQIGQAFLPVQEKLYEGLNKLFGVIRENVIPAIKEWYEEHQPEIDAALEEFQRIIEEDVVPIVQELAKVAEEWWPRIQKVVETVWPFIENQIVTTMKVIRDTINIVLALLHGDWSGAWEGIKQLFSDIWDGIVTDLKLKLALVRDVLVWVLGALKTEVWDRAVEMGKAIPQAMWDGIQQLKGWLLDKARGFVGDLIGILNPANWFGSPKGLQNWLPYYFEEGFKNLEQTIASLRSMGRIPGMLVPADIGLTPWSALKSAAVPMSSVSNQFSLSMPLTLNMPQAADWAMMRRAAHIELDAMLDRARTQSFKAGQSLGSGIG